MFEFQFSQAVGRLKSSEIRELMKLAARPNLIVFGGGMPAPELFPYEAVKEIQEKWDAKKAAIAFQYGPTPGVPIILEALKPWIEKHDISLDGQQIMVTSGAQQSLSLISRIFVDVGTKIVVEKPTFVGAMACFLVNGAKLLWADMEDDGIDLNKLEDLFQKEKPRFFYTIPNFQNPSGITLSQAKREAVLDLANKYGVIIIEDDPYGELYFEGSPEDYRSIKTRDRNNMVINIGTFSKMLSPGMRVGWMVGPELPVSKCETVRQSQDACGASFTQVLCADYMSSGLIYPALEKMRGAYKERRDAMAAAINDFFPDWVKVSHPNGGFFFWLNFGNRIGSRDFFKRGIDRGVAVITGHAFMPPEDAECCCRVSYSTATPQKIREGIEILGNVLHEV